MKESASNLDLSAGCERLPADVAAGLPTAQPGDPVRPSFSFASVQTPMRLLVCPECDVAFLAPAGLVERQGRVFCPAGHAQPVGDDPQSVRTLAAALADARRELACRERELAELRARVGAAGLPDNREVRRRCNLLSRRAEPAGGIDLVCPVCGKAKAGAAALSNHCYRQHRESVRAMPAARFE